MSVKKSRNEATWEMIAFGQLYMDLIWFGKSAFNAEVPRTLVLHYIQKEGNWYKIMIQGLNSDWNDFYFLPQLKSSELQQISALCFLMSMVMFQTSQVGKGDWAEQDMTSGSAVPTWANQGNLCFWTKGNVLLLIHWRWVCLILPCTLNA